MSNSQILVPNIEQIKKIITINDSNIISAINGKVMNSKGKRNDCYIVVTNHGIYILKGSFLSKSLKVKHFIHILKIKKIQYLNNNTRVLVAFPQEINIVSNEIKIAEDSIMSILSILNYRSNRKHEIEFIGFPDTPSFQPLTNRPANLSVTRYSILSSMYDSAIDHKLRHLFEYFESSSRVYFHIDDSISEPEYPIPISGSIYSESDLVRVSFNKFAPESIALILKKILQFSKTLHTIDLKGYSIINEESIKFNEIPKPSVVSWSFVDCFQDSNKFISFFQGFSQYCGQLQKLRISNISMPLAIAKQFFNLLKTSRCYLTLEIIELENVVTSEKNCYEIFKLFETTCRCFPRLVKMSASGWKDFLIYPEISLNDNFLISQCSELRHLDLSYTNFISLQGSIIFPKKIIQLDCSNCMFSSSSLISFFTSISKIEGNLSLDLSNFIMRKGEKSVFYRDFSSMDPLNNIVELSWNDNEYPPGFSEQFCRVLMPQDSFRFLSISRVFSPESMSELFQLMEYLSKTKLYGLEINGGPGFAFQNNVDEFWRKLKDISTLEYFEFRNHEIPEKTALEFVKIIRSLKMLHEVLLDGLLLPSRSAFFGFYGQIWSIKNIRAVSFPYQDYCRVLTSSFYTSDWKTDRFVKFQERLNSKLVPSDPFMRSEFFQSGIDITKFAEYHQSFPVSLKKLEEVPIGIISIDDKCSSLRSCADTSFSSINDISFSDYQAKFLMSPFRPPFFEASQEVAVPQNLHRFFGVDNVYINSEEINAMNKNTIETPVIRQDFIDKYSGLIKIENKDFFDILDTIQNRIKPYVTSIDSEIPKSRIVSESPHMVLNQAEIDFLKQELVFMVQKQKEISSKSSKPSFQNSISTQDIIRTFESEDSDYVSEKTSMDSRSSILRNKSSERIKLVSMRRSMAEESSMLQMFNEEEMHPLIQTISDVNNGPDYSRIVSLLAILCESGKVLFGKDCPHSQKKTKAILSPYPVSDSFLYEPEIITDLRACSDLVKMVADPLDSMSISSNSLYSDLPLPPPPMESILPIKFLEENSSLIPVIDGLPPPPFVFQSIDPSPNPHASSIKKIPTVINVPNQLIPPPLATKISNISHNPIPPPLLPTPKATQFSLPLPKYNV